MNKEISRRELLRTARAFLGGSALGCASGTFPRPVGDSDGGKGGGRPNFVVIFADDLGYGDLGCYGAEAIQTPELDRMASEGLRFTSFYVCCPVCSPSRAGLLTGRYPGRTSVHRVFFPTSADGLPPQEITLGQRLQDCGYATACIGKWHLGHLPPYLPTRRGFDRYFGVPYSNDMDRKESGYPPLPLMRDEEIVERPVDQDTLTGKYTEEAVRFIRDCRERPFFLYLAHTMPHVPLHTSDAFRGRSARGLYGDVVEEIDWSVGRVLDELRRLGLAERTLVIFTSDNGPWLAKGEHGGSAGPLREGKATTFEGGVRVPCIAWHPGAIAAGRTVDAPAITLDLFPTFVRMAGGVVPDDRVIDGCDIFGMLYGKAKRRHDEFFFYIGDQVDAHRSGPWKLKRAFRGHVHGKPIEHPTLLFNLEEDPGERVNLSDAYPDITARLALRASAFQQEACPGT